MVDRSFLLINFRSICSLIYACTFWDTPYIYIQKFQKTPQFIEIKMLFTIIEQVSQDKYRFSVSSGTRDWYRVNVFSLSLLASSRVPRSIGNSQNYLRKSR